MSRMGQKRQKVNQQPETALAEYKPHKMSVKEETFCLQFVITDDRRLSYERAGYLATAPNVQSAAISRMLKQPKIKARIEELTTELLLAQGVTKERITANLAEIAFTKANTKADRNRALELLGKTMAMFSDTVNLIDMAQQRELDAREAEECRQIALIRLKMQISGNTTEQPTLQLEGVKDALQGQGTAETGAATANAEQAECEPCSCEPVTCEPCECEPADDSNTGGAESTSAGELRAGGLPVLVLPDQPGDGRQEDSESRGLQDGGAANGQ